jgi:hypothetical protein
MVVAFCDPTLSRARSQLCRVAVLVASSCDLVFVRVLVLLGCPVGRPCLCVITLLPFRTARHLVHTPVTVVFWLSCARCCFAAPNSCLSADGWPVGSPSGKPCGCPGGPRRRRRRGGQEERGSTRRKGLRPRTGFANCEPLECVARDAAAPAWFGFFNISDQPRPSLESAANFCSIQLPSLIRPAHDDDAGISPTLVFPHVAAFDRLTVYVTASS